MTCLFPWFEDDSDGFFLTSCWRSTTTALGVSLFKQPEANCGFYSASHPLLRLWTRDEFLHVSSRGNSIFGLKMKPRLKSIFGYIYRFLKNLFGICTESVKIYTCFLAKNECWWKPQLSLDEWIGIRAKCCLEYILNFRLKGFASIMICLVELWLNILHRVFISTKRHGDRDEDTQTTTAAQVSTSQYDKVNTKHQLLWCWTDCFCQTVLL